MYINSFTGKKALFLGNGIHRTEKNNGISWGNLLQTIADHYHIKTNLQNPLKPFPLLFEEMLYTKEGRTNFENKLKNLKTRISETLIKDADNLIDIEIHQGFMQSNVSEIITTNYDYNLELSIDPKFISNKINYSINNQESKHSLYRGYYIDNKVIRHIHGELKHNRNVRSPKTNYPEESIMIGFEHYSDYFLKIQHAVKGNSGFQKESINKGIITRLKNNDTFKIWTDLFFTHHIIFAGFSLDFSENHLWWLLIQREELKRKSEKYGIRINNKITFCIPEFPPNFINYNIKNEEEFNLAYNKRLNSQKNQGVTDILSSLKVTIKIIECKSYHDFYLKIIDSIEKIN